MQCVTLVLSIVLINSCCSVNGANILGVFIFPSPSHHMLGSTLLKELVRRGHNVTMISPFPLKEPTPNFTHIDLDEVIHLGEEMTAMVVKIKSEKDRMPFMLKTYMDICQRAMSNGDVQQLTTSGQRFDAIVYDVPGNDAFLGLTHIFDAPAILFSPFGDMHMLNVYTGNYCPLSYVSGHDLLDLSTFAARLTNVVKTAMVQFYMDWWFKGVIDDLHGRFFPGAPPLDEMRQNVALLLINSHYTYETARPYTPNVIPIGGFNLIGREPVAKELRDWIDASADGVVLVSYGSKIKGFAFDSEKVNLFLNVFRTLKQRILWKFDADDLKNMSGVVEVPPNVRFQSWIPQKEVLNHPNVKLFVTHGGMGGITESIYGGVPMVGTPFYGDQVRNVKNMAINYGYGIGLDFHSLTESALEAAVREVLTNPRYANAIKRASTAFKNQPICPLEKAMFWIEHVVQFKGADHLKPASLRLTAYQHQLYDVGLFLVALVALTTYVSYRVLRRLFALIFKRKSKSKLE